MGIIDRLLGRPEPPPEPLGAVTVQLKTGTAVRGLLVAWATDGLVLRAAQLAGLDRNQQIVWKTLAGEVVIPMDNLDYWQQGLEPQVLTE